MPNPARPDLPGRSPTPPLDAAGDRTEEAATTHPTHTRHTECARAPHRRVPSRRVPSRRVPSRRLARVSRHRLRAVLRRLPVAVLLTAGLLVIFAAPAFAAGSGAPTLSGVIDNLRNWIVGILAGVATLFLTIGGLRYVTAGGDPGQVEKAKIALKSAAIGYALAILAPLLVSILASVVGG